MDLTIGIFFGLVVVSMVAPFLCVPWAWRILHDRDLNYELILRMECRLDRIVHASLVGDVEGGSIVDANDWREKNTALINLMLTYDFERQMCREAANKSFRHWPRLRLALRFAFCIAFCMVLAPAALGTTIEWGGFPSFFLSLGAPLGLLSGSLLTVFSLWAGYRWDRAWTEPYWQAQLELWKAWRTF